MLCRVKNVVIIFALMFGLQGCITLSDISTGVGATAGAAASSAVGLGVPATVALTVTGATVGAAAIEDTVQTVTAETLKEVTNPWQAFALAFQGLLNHAFEIVIAIGIAVIAIPMVMSFAVGKVMPNKKTKDAMKENEVLHKLMEKQHAETSNSPDGTGSDRSH